MENLGQGGGGSSLGAIVLECPDEDQENALTIDENKGKTSQAGPAPPSHSRAAISVKTLTVIITEKLTY